MRKHLRVRSRRSDHDRNDRSEVTVAKQRVYELARDLGRESKEVLARAQELGLDVKTASSGLDEDAGALVRLSFEETDRASAEAPGSAELEATEARPDGSAEQDAVGAVAAEDVPEPETAEAPIGEAVDVEPAGDATGGNDRVLLLEPGITAHDFARMVGTRTGDVVRELMSMGELVPGGGTIPTGALERLGTTFGYEVLVADVEEVEEEVGPQRYPRRIRRRPGQPRISTTGGDGHGPRRPRQDPGPGHHPQGQRDRWGSRGDHPAHRCVPSVTGREHDHLHRYARPRSVHRAPSSRAQT